MSDLSSQIESAAAQPASATADGQSVQGQPIDKLIEADRYLAAKSAVAAGQLPFRNFKIEAPGGG